MARGRGRGQGNRGRRSGRANSGRGKGGPGKGTGKGKGKGKGKGASSGRRGGQGNRGRTSTKNNAASNKGKRGGYGKGGASTGRRGGQGNRNRAPGRAKGTVSTKSIGKGLSRFGRITRHLRQPVTGLSSLAIKSVLNNPAIARNIAQYGANTFGAQNQRTRDMSKLTPQQRRKFERLSEKTGRDYSIRKPTFRLNLNMRDIAKFAGLDKNKMYNRFTTPAIRNAQINKQFYGNPMKKGWHSSQRTGRGQGLKELGRMRDMMMRPEDWERQKQRQQNEAAERQYEYDRKQYEMSKDHLSRSRDRMGPQQDWLSSLYTSHNINRGKLDQGARDYWTNEAKTKGRDAVMQSIIGTSKAQGTYGGRKKPRRIDATKLGPLPWHIGRGSPYPSKEKRERERAKRRGKGMLAKTIAATMAARGI